jgi:hypothetical protein
VSRRLFPRRSELAKEPRYQRDDSRRGLVSRDAEALAKAAHNLDRALDKSNLRDDVAGEHRRVTDSYEQLHSHSRAQDMQIRIGGRLKTSNA